MAFFLGIDAGGSATRCVVGDEYRILGRAQTSSCKIQRVGEAEARRALHAVIREACQVADVAPGRIEQACIGISGASHPEVVERVRHIINEVISAPVEVLGDIIIALEAGLGPLAGCMVIAGTGSIAVGRNQQGTLARAGGWGPAASDEGSGYWIGRAAVAAILRAHDSGESTALARAIMAAWHIASYEDFERAASASPPPDFAQLFPTVLTEAEQGDPIATDVLQRAGMELAELALVVIRRLWPGPQRVRVTICGGVLENSSLIRRAFASKLRSACPQSAISFGNIEPVTGALSLARKHAARSSEHSAVGVTKKR
ncbi:MAG TPA: BadF/BadG/BcrA/BcrD ATPase family protein [Terriglobales bacterium]|nr:BadF/BadG/BcrA/BcrD ATPase family protein [Terriglobales bacterium]